MNKIKSFILLLGFLSLSIIALAQQDKLIIDSIKVEGAKTISKEAVINKMRSRIGSIYSPELVSQDIKSLYGTGFFSDVEITPQIKEGGVTLIVKVKERKVLGKIEIVGNRRIPKKLILQKIDLKPGQFLDERKVKEAVESIKSLYKSKGYSNAEVSYKLVPVRDNKNDLLFYIKEGIRERIVRIIVKGNHHFSDGRILKLIETKKANLWNLGQVNKERLESDMERIRDFYLDKGFLDVEVSYRLEPTKRAGNKILEIFIKEGKQYHIGSIKIEGNSKIPTEELMKVVHGKTGDLFSPSKVEKDASRIQDKYFEQGYIFAKVIPLPSVDRTTGKIDLVFDVKEGELAYVNRIIIKGNTKTKDKVIRRELRIYPGDRFDGEKLRRSMQRLMNLGYFEEVSYDIKDTSDPLKKDLIVKVKETETGEFSFGAGYSTVDKFVGFVKISQNNFDITNWPTFTGGGQKLSVMYERGSDNEDYTLSFTEPWMFDKPISGGFDLYRTSHDRETDVGYGHSEERRGINLRLGRELGEYTRIDGNFKIERIRISDLDENASYLLQREVGKNMVHTIGLQWKDEHRDNVFSPKKGYYLKLALDLAGGPLGGDKDFYRIYTDGAYYLPFLFDDGVLSLRLRIGIVNNFGDSDYVPIYERFFAGGAYSIRGYRERKVSPLDPNTGDPIGGEALLVGNIECLIPIFEKVKMATFFDFGNVWEDVNDFLSNTLYYSVGLGIRVKTPIGPMRLDYGYPLKTEPGEDKKKGRFHFSISRGF